jgi:uncharacterized membrane protein YfcA
MWLHLLLFGVGLAAGFLNVLAGGGSLLSMPVMVFCGMDGATANGTNRIAILAQNIAATISFLRHGTLKLSLALGLAVCTLPGSIFGALLGTKIEGVAFNRFLAVVMLVVLGIMLLPKKRLVETKDTSEELSDGGPEGGSSLPGTDNIPRWRLALTCLGMVGIGFYGGIIQGGIGFFIIAILSHGLRLDLIRVNALKVFIIGVYTPVALLIFALSGEVDWFAGLALACGNSLGAYLGARFSLAKGEKVVRWFVWFAMGAMALRLLFSSY